MNALSLYLTASWHPADSYGKIAIELAKHAHSKGIHVNCLGHGEATLDAQSAEVRQITSQPLVASLGGIALGWPTSYPKFPTLYQVGPRIALTMFESTRLPDDWIPHLNHLHAVIVPSHFCQRVFVESGVTVPVHVINLGVNDHFRYIERPLSFTESRPMTFLAFMDRGQRKGGITALQGFLRAFGDDPTKKLILKGRKIELNFHFTNPNIEAIQEDYDDAQMQALYERCDVLVNPHRGEGFGIIPREFAASGGLSLTTGWSATLEHIDEWGYALPFRLEKALWEGNKYLQGRELGEWATVDEVKLGDTLRAVANYWPLYHHLLPKRSLAARTRYSWATFGDQVLALWEDVVHATTYQESAATH